MIWLNVVKAIARVAWAVFRTMLIMFLAIVFGGFRGASKAKQANSNARD